MPAQEFWLPDTINITKQPVSTVHINPGNRCNQTCFHCHIQHPLMVIRKWIKKRQLKSGANVKTPTLLVPNTVLPERLATAAVAMVRW